VTTGGTAPAAPEPADAVHEPVDSPDYLERRSRVYRAVVNVERYLTTGILVATFVAIMLQVVTRYAFSSPLSWTEELARFLMVWLTFLGAGYVMSRRLHISVDLLVARLSKRGAVVVDTFATLVVLVASAALAIASVGIASDAADLLAPATRLPMSVVYAAGVVGFGLIFLHGLANLFVNLRHPEEVPGAMENIEKEGF
jgi:TRAP-type C4-dicarboxylate transport system permease small subunit